MITQKDLEYHLRREREERARAMEAGSGEARVAHLELAGSHGRRAANAQMFLARREAAPDQEKAELGNLTQRVA